MSPSTCPKFPWFLPSRAAMQGTSSPPKSDHPSSVHKTPVPAPTIARFPDSKQVARYVGLAPAVAAAADKQRLGKITKQGSALLRWVLGQAAPLAARADE